MKTTNLFEKIVRKILTPLACVLFTAGLLVSMVGPVNAQDVFSTLKEVGDQSKLPSYQTNTHANASIEPGVSNISSAILYAADFAKYVLGSIAVITIIISGIRLITGGRQIDQVIEKQKEQLKYSIIGLVVIIAADQFVKQVFWGDQGEVFGSQGQLVDAAQKGSAQIQGIYSGIIYFAGAVAILMIIIAGFRLVTGAGNEELEGKSKSTITYAVIGLVVLGLAEFVVKDIFFPKQGTTLPDIEKAKLLVINLTNFASGFISTLAFVILIYGGYLYVTAFGNEDGSAKAKKVIVGAVIGLLIALAAFAIVNTTVKMEAIPSIQSAGFNSPANLPTNPNL